MYSRERSPACGGKCTIPDTERPVAQLLGRQALRSLTNDFNAGKSLELSTVVKTVFYSKTHNKRQRRENVTEAHTIEIDYTSHNKYKSG